ncbi:MAG: transporter substrate-binding domain-containing protein [Magnetospirillum sp.]|nr:transporter substrate-binding domain-containing protein [Magnetospirillum sp.]
MERNAVPQGLAIFLALCLVSRVAVGADLAFITVEAAPWASFDEAAKRATGAFPDLVAELERRTGHSIAIAMQPYARVERELESGSHDCTILLWSDTRAAIVERGEDVYAMSFGIIARSGVPLTAYEDLRPLTVSVIRGLSLDPRFDGDDGLRKDFDKDYRMGLTKIAHGRADAIAGALPTIVHLARRLGIEAVLGDRLVVNRRPLALQCSRHSRHPGTMEGLNAALRAMRGDGSLSRILARHGYF